MLERETLNGIRKILMRADVKSGTPILIIVKNIKSLNPSILNDLIHLIS